MNYYSLNKQSPIADFRQATIDGQAPDGGLYFPDTIPQHSAEWIKDLNKYSRAEIAFKVIAPFTGKTIPEDILWSIVNETIDFPIPLIKVDKGIYLLELFHGPTLAFKDVGARFMSRCLGYFAKEKSEKITVLVATSGDTGGAVASGFHNVDGVNVVILYPSGKVSAVQEKQLTTFGGNIQALEVEGNFDDCQKMVKEAFRDKELKEKIFLTSANSINVARWLPQQFYYFFALQQWKQKEAPVFSVPSGNFGNICAGIMAWKTGLPVKHFIAACNSNDVVSDYLHTGIYQPKTAVPTISNAMDVGNPSNFSRILELFHNNADHLKDIFSSYTTSDDRTREVMMDVYRNDDYLLDPHGAVGYDALLNWLSMHPNDNGIVLETAHPIKFLDIVEPLIQEQIEIPENIRYTMSKQKDSILIGNNYEALRSFLLRN
ncbi:threonine synthase [Flavihumibacter sediminis]|nr:threonine synthase [Flavihumibacter sediminis]